jgi:hypothetical protein
MKIKSVSKTIAFISVVLIIGTGSYAFAKQGFVNNNKRFAYDRICKNGIEPGLQSMHRGYKLQGRNNMDDNRMHHGETIHIKNLMNSKEFQKESGINSEMYGPFGNTTDSVM